MYVLSQRRTIIMVRGEIMDHSNRSSACRVLLLNGALLLFAVMQVGSAAEVGKKNPLIGTWLVVKYVDTSENGQPIFAFGREPIGHFIFTPGRHVAFSIMRN